MESISKGKKYIAIDLKSFYASVECVERGLDPLTTNLVVADVSRTEKTICLAVSPSLKSYGIPGRVRLFEVVQKVKEVNAQRRRKAPGGTFAGRSVSDPELKADPSLELDYIAARPRMALYMKTSTQIYQIYLKYAAPEDIHVYSIDEVFIDVTGYLKTYGLTAAELAQKMILDVLAQTGITATAGIGTNLFLCKAAMDIVAKHVQPDENGVRIAELDERSFREQLWDHRPLIDFWRVGRGYVKKLENIGIYTMGDIARCSIGKPTDYYNEDLLYDLFGVNAELLIDHAWGWEPTQISDIKAYKPEKNSTGSGQVLQYPYDYAKTRVVVREMTDSVVMGLVESGLVTDRVVLTVGYDIENLKDPDIRKKYKGPVVKDFYGRSVPKAAHGTANLGGFTSSSSKILDAVTQLYDRIINRDLLVRRINVAAENVKPKSENEEPHYEQLSLFEDYGEKQKKREEEKAAQEKEEKIQKALLDIRKKYGKNAVLRGMNFEEGATGRERSGQIGGHKA